MQTEVIKLRVREDCIVSVQTLCQFYARVFMHCGLGFLEILEPYPREPREQLEAWSSGSSYCCPVCRSWYQAGAPLARRQSLPTNGSREWTTWLRNLEAGWWSIIEGPQMSIEHVFKWKSVGQALGTVVELPAGMPTQQSFWVRVLASLPIPASC